MAIDVYSQQWLLPRYGMYALDYGDVWPDLTEEARRLYRDKLGTLPWLPADWRQSITALHGKDGKFLAPAPSNATAPDGSRIKFLDTQEKRDVWDSVVDDINKVRQAIINREREKGLYLLRMLYQQSSFWNSAHKLATVVALPATAAGAAYDTAAGAADALGKYPKLITTALAIGGLTLAYYTFFRRR